MFGNSIRKLLALTVLMFGFAAAPAMAVEIVISQSTDATSLDPAFRAGTATANVQRHIYDTILFRNPSMEIVPRLAESVEKIDDTNWTVKLRAGLTFSNGEALDAAAVKFSIERMQDPVLKSPIRGWFKGFSNVEIVDEQTLIITTSKRDPLFLARMTLLAPVPPKYVAEVGNTVFAREPISSGPYTLSVWRRDEMVVLEANPDYWGGKPAIDKVTFRVLPEELARVAALQTGEADVVSNISPTQGLALEGLSGFKIERASSTRVMVVQFDITKPPGDQQKFRDAVAYAIDPDAIIKGLLRGYGSKVNSLLSPGIPGWPRDRNFNRSYDPAKAKQLVEELGLGDQEILMRTPSGRYTLDRETALAVAGQLRAVGLNIKVRPDEWGVFFGDLKNRSMSPIYLMGQGNVWVDPFPQINAFQRTEGFLSTWSDPVLDDLLEQSHSVRGAEREAVFAKALERIAETSAAVPLFAHQALYGVAERIEWTPRPDGKIFAFEMKVTN